MCYRCSLCRFVVPPKVPRLLSITYRDVPVPRVRVEVPDVLHERRTVQYEVVEGRTRKEIAREVPVCQTCHDALGRGVTPAELRKAVAEAAPMPDIARVVVDELPKLPKGVVPQGGRKSTKRPV